MNQEVDMVDAESQAPVPPSIGNPPTEEEVRRVDLHRAQAHLADLERNYSYMYHRPDAIFGFGGQGPNPSGSGRPDAHTRPDQHLTRNNPVPEDIRFTCIIYSHKGCRLTRLSMQACTSCGHYYGPSRRHNIRR
jgi:hypothetical protein